MQSGPAGGDASDGVWTSHWYGAVNRSTGVAGPEAALPKLYGAVADLAAQGMAAYNRLAAVKLVS